MSNHESGSVRNYWVACGPTKKGEKGQIEDGSPRRRCMSYLPCSGGIDFWGKGFPAFWPWNFPFIERRNKCFLSFYTRFWISYKLSIEYIGPLQPNKRVAYTSCCFFQHQHKCTAGFVDICNSLFLSLSRKERSCAVDHLVVKNAQYKFLNYYYYYEVSGLFLIR